ncbi:hypothetical protein UA08_03703 [Talaromyces atroroseus]|uniref:Uncharacterized protein n=1 Tax=Talaromyces atroroseus TaxID=1441469 RepID=A0A225AIT0_TALAT|nr:hypothetical protein UA08_03703 [Talaromyces atroroseus]OKL61372.1 hypothetical protein UA08_03703 [Talaromyces atroroseus]
MTDAVATQLQDLPLLVTAESCIGRTYIVTGANTGLGYEAAKHLVALGAARVILAVRNLTAGKTALANIVKETGKEENAEVWALDLSSYDSVKAFASKAIAKLDRIDAVIENAAVATDHDKAEGRSLCLTVNVFGTFLLGVLLFSKLRESARAFGITPHLTIVTSGTAFDIQAKWNELRDDPLVKMDKEDIGRAIYPLSKLLEVLFVRQLASLVPVSRSGVVINLVNPGLCKTELSRNASPEFRQQLAKLHASYGRTAEVGSRTLLHGAVGGKESHGCYLSSCEIAEYKVPSWVTDEAGKKTQELVWSAIAEELELISPGCMEFVEEE